ncbi:hypothetical protein [Kitasatospora viridis]|uniref:Uncharacterized protein n=1 Tax=Kitasatospora viridis TaxID=281105 RepID=A0A561ULJ4_9ACTN|nr:hypothetical protein [Kitasatospora viridis]TWG00253.1 hypothetical protein FHX73_114126 [Kitasatospora viridis]
MDRRIPPRAAAPSRSRALAAPVAVATGAALSLGLALAGCSSSSSSKATSAASSAASAAQSALSSIGGQVASQAASAASSALSAAASFGSSAVASAQSAASSAFASATGGLDATGDVSLGTVATGSDGKAQVPVTVTNQQSDAKRYTVQVDFKDQNGSLLDTVVLNVGPVPAGQSANATATGNRSLSGTVNASVERAVRY